MPNKEGFLRIALIVVATIAITQAGYSIMMPLEKEGALVTDTKSEKKDLMQEISQHKAKEEELRDIIRRQNDALNQDATHQLYNEMIRTIENACVANDCLGDTNALGFAVLEGYYSQIDRSAIEETQTCDAIILTGGSEKLIASYKEKIASGNSVYSMNQDGMVIANIGIASLSSRDQDRIKASTPNKPVRILVHAYYNQGRYAWACHSFFKILKVLD